MITVTTVTTFHLFPTFPREIRNLIWKHALPPPRILHVRPRGGPYDGFNQFSGDTYYTTKPSYGGRHPAILFASRESRSEALRYLTKRFAAYWNLEIDTLYLEHREPAGAYDATSQLLNLRARKMLGGFKHLAIEWESWGTNKPDDCWTSLKSLTGIHTCLLIYREPPIYLHGDRMRSFDKVVPGVAWEIAPISDWIHKEVLNTIRRDIGRVIVNDGTTLSWTLKQSTEESPELGVASISCRKTVDKRISEAQLMGERGALDWFG